MRAEGRPAGWQGLGAAGAPSSGTGPEADAGGVEDADKGRFRQQSRWSCCSPGRGRRCRSLPAPWLRHQGHVSGLKPVGQGSSSEPWGLVLRSDVPAERVRSIRRNCCSRRRTALSSPEHVLCFRPKAPLSEAEGRRAAARSLEASPGDWDEKGRAGEGVNVSKGRGLRTGPGLKLQLFVKGRRSDEPGACVCERVMGMRQWEGRARTGAGDLAQ